MWIFSALAGLGLTALSLRSQLEESVAERALLANINGALKLEARELVGQAHRDSLTGVLNRQGLRAELMSISSLLADPMSVIFVDLDYFKRVNDNHGHDAGDNVLRTFANVVGSGIRQSDRLVRWGGEEFLIVCPLTNAQQAAVLAESLRQALHKATWPLGMKLTASFGIAQLQKDADMSVVIKHADEALYNAKGAGRDRVTVYGAAS
jgi:diguanylate cyclase (GGDEF)-like protein